MVGKTWFMQQQEARMDGKASEANGESINVRIAKLLGWRVEERDYGRTFNGDIVTRCYLVAPDGSERIFTSAQKAWDSAPDLEHSVDAVLATLPVNDGHLYDVRLVQHLAGGFTAFIIRDTPPLGSQKRWEGKGATRAEALANARLALLEAQEATR